MIELDEKYPSLTILADQQKDHYMHGGPSINTLSARVEVAVDGELVNYEITGNGILQNHLLLRTLKETQSYIHTSQTGTVRLSKSYKIIFQYGLSFVKVTYEIPIPNEAPDSCLIVEKLIYPALKETSAFGIQFSVSTRKYSKSFIATISVGARFTLGDSYTLIGKWKNGWLLYNRLNLRMNGFFTVVDRQDIPEEQKIQPLHLFIREDVVEWKYEREKAIFLNSTESSKPNEEHLAVIQQSVAVNPNSPNNTIFLLGSRKGIRPASVVVEPFIEYLKQHKISEYETLLLKEAESNFIIQTPDPIFNQQIAVAIKTANTYFMIRGKPFAMPGHQYPRFYARDSHWQLKGILLKGDFALAKNMIARFFNKQKLIGSFPTSVNLDGTGNQFTFWGADLDGVILPVLSLLDYVRSSQDFAFAKKYWRQVKRALRYLQHRDKDGDGFIEQKGNQDWADVLKRGGKVTYSQSIYYEMLQQLRDCAEILKDNGTIKKCNKTIKKMQQSFESLFWDESAQVYADYIKEDTSKVLNANQDAALAIVYGLASNQAHSEALLKKLKEHCWTEWGPGKQEPYDVHGTWGPAGFYHNGGIWLWCATFEATARFLLKQPEDAMWILKICRDYDFGKNPYCYHYFEQTEWYSPITGENNFHIYKSSKFFTTGSGAYLWSIIRGLFGVDLKMNGQISCKPNLPKDWDPNKCEISLPIGSKLQKINGKGLSDKL